MLNERGLMDLKEEIAEAETKASELQGKADHLKEELVKTWGCKTEKAAAKKLDGLATELSEIETKIDSHLLRIGEEFPEWIGKDLDLI
jgi:predicted  nucleic acid-binding Zn-ribbon protein